MFAFTLFAQTNNTQIKVLSPVEGVWCNKQMLVIDNSDNAEYYYSLNGSDPELFGFAYDSPVLIDLTGDITLKIKKITKKTYETTINFKVHQDEAINSNYHSFISMFSDSGLINYTAGTELNIPSELLFSFGLPPDSFIKGQTVSISEKSVLIRYIPCTIYDPTTLKKWRFLVKTFPQNAGLYSRRDIPFYITDWETITFTDQNQIYKIDSEYWNLPKESAKLDRSVSHMISWQSIDYEFGNPIQYFVLPPKPIVNQSTDINGCVIYSIDGDDSYSLSILSNENHDYQELYKTIGVDTFYGDNASGKMNIGIFSNAIYQGEMTVSYSIKKRPPANPVITSSSNSFYSRLPVKVSIKGEKDSDLYISTSAPYFIKDNSEIYSPDDKSFNDVKMSTFKKADSNSINFLFEPQGEGAALFKIRAFSQSGDNKGQISEYSVIIDQYNYYFDANANPEKADGTADHPYTDFEQCIESVNNGTYYARLRVKGPIKMPNEQITILSNCEIINDGNASLVFSEKSSVLVKNSNFKIDGCRIEVKTENKESNKSTQLIKLENSLFNMINCQVAAVFGKNGTLIDSYSSSVILRNNIISLSSKVYASCISSVKTKVDVQNSIINLNTDTGVTFSANEGTFIMKKNNCKIIGKKGRIAELFSVKGSIVDNSFTAELKKTENGYPIFKDTNSSIKDLNNEYYGF